MKPSFGDLQRPYKARPQVRLDDMTIGLARRFAKSMVGYVGFSRSDVEDITHDLLQRLLCRSIAFNPKRGHWRAFAATVLLRQAASYLRDARAKKRDRRQITSLDRYVGASDGHETTLADLIGESQKHVRHGQQPRSATELAQLTVDVADATKLLPPQLCELKHRLMHNCVAHVARDMGISRSAVYSGIRRIRSVFEDAGLRHYLA